MNYNGVYVARAALILPGLLIIPLKSAGPRSLARHCCNKVYYRVESQSMAALGVGFIPVVRYCPLVMVNKWWNYHHTSPLSIIPSSSHRTAVIWLLFMLLTEKVTDKPTDCKGLGQTNLKNVTETCGQD